MLTIATLRALSEARLEDARALLLAGRNEGSLYLCGYAVELALKAKICETLGWRWFPDTGKEAADYRSFRTHNLEVLLYLSGVYERIAVDLKEDWARVLKWQPELRYAITIADSETPTAATMMSSAERILEAL